MKYLVSVLVVLVVAGGALAQPYNTDVLAAHIGFASTGLFGDVFRIDPQGLITTALSLSTLSPVFPNMVGMDNNNFDLIVLESNTRANPIQDRLTVFDLSLSTPVQTLQGPTGSSLNWFDSTGTGDFLVAGSTLVGILRRDGSGFSTVRSGSPFVSLHCCHYDVGTGGYFAGDLTGNAVYLVAQDGTITTTHKLTSMRPYSMTQDHRDGKLYIGNGGGARIHVIDPISGITTLPGSYGNANAITFDRWSGNGEIVVGSKPVYRVDTAGKIVTSHPGLPNISNSGMCFEYARNLVSVKTGTPNRYRYDLHVPGQSGKPYILALSDLGFTPGLPIGNRVVHLVAGPLFFWTAAGQFPWLKNNVGVLSSDRDPRKDARASATLDLSSFGNILKGMRLWAAAVTVDLAHPTNIGVITKPIVLVLD